MVAYTFKHTRANVTQALTHRHARTHSHTLAHQLVYFFLFSSRTWWMTIRQTISWHLVELFSTMLPTVFPKGKPPHNVTIYKGSNQAVLTRKFVEYLLFNKTAIDLLDWFRDTLAPDEYLWPTINHNPHLRAPGGYTGKIWRHTHMQI